MAKLYPSFEIINASKVQPTEGERRLLTFLVDNLESSYEVYFQPFLNGDNPDIVIMKEGSGAIIIEVKDWNFQHYEIKERMNWILKKNNTPILSPLDQVESYKDNLFKLHISTLLEKKISNDSYLKIVNCAIYFHNETETSISNFISTPFSKNLNYCNKINRITFWGSNSLNRKKLDDLLKLSGINQPSSLFDNDLYLSFKRYLKPPFHRLEDGIPITYTKDQSLLIDSKPARQKIKGVAGSGKTLVLAKRAVNAHKRTGKKILILTYNLSLINYIHDRISDVREDFYWEKFYITNYHQFFKSQANNLNLEIRNLAAWQDTDFFTSVKNRIQQFDCIFIDEVQDYKTEWLEIITKDFLDPNGEFVVFGDEKQNIYDRQMDANKEPIIKTVKGAWNRSLNTPKRCTSKIAKIAQRFQIEFFKAKYILDDFNFNQTALDLENNSFEYFFFQTGLQPNELFRKIFDVIKKYNLSPSDIGILNSKVDFIRTLDYEIRRNKSEKTETTFEPLEVYQQIKRNKKVKWPSSDDKAIEKLIHKELEDFRRNRKNHFWMKSGTMKMSTIHSFKGWEIHSLFLLIEGENDGGNFGTNELVYTGLTRARVNLFILNMGNLRFHNFFTGLPKDITN